MPVKIKFPKTTKKKERPASVSVKAGMPPGTLIHVGSKHSQEIKITVMNYSDTVFDLQTIGTAEEAWALNRKDCVTWVNVDGLHDTKLIEEIGNKFGLHHLLLEDVLNTTQRPKEEDFDNYSFLTLKMLGMNPNGLDIISEQVSIVLGDGWVLSFQEQEGDIFEPMRGRLKASVGITRRHGADFLLYRLLDTVVDHYFIVVEYLSEVIEKLEEDVLKESSRDTLREIQRLKRLIRDMGRSVRPLREAVSGIQREGNTQVTTFTRRYLRDVYEHIIQVGENMDIHRDTLNSIMELYLSGESNRTNQVMQVLTIIATIFIPLTFIAGIYGMNFDHMPELHWRYSYYAVWAVMLAIIIGMLFYFRRKKWL